MMWQEEGYIMYEIFFANFWVIILCPVFNQSINQFICTVTRIYTIKRVQAGQQGHISGTNRCPI